MQPNSGTLGLPAVPASGGEKPSSPEDQMHYQQRVLLRALQIGHPVLYQNRQCFIHALSFNASGGGIDLDVYLAGQPNSVAPMEIELDPNYRKKYALIK